MRLLGLVAFLALPMIVAGCSDDEADAAAGNGGGSTADPGGAGGGPSSSGSGANGGGSSSAGGGGGGAIIGCGACGNACTTEAGEGVCTGEGDCVVSRVSCPGWNPCLELPCGEPCSSCDPADPACVPVPGAVCDDAGLCIGTSAACD